MRAKRFSMSDEVVLEQNALQNKTELRLLLPPWAVRDLEKLSVRFVQDSACVCVEGSSYEAKWELKAEREDAPEVQSAEGIGYKLDFFAIGTGAAGATDN